jgi:hypothetical protein
MQAPTSLAHLKKARIYKQPILIILFFIVSAALAFFPRLHGKGLSFFLFFLLKNISIKIKNLSPHDDDVLLEREITLASGFGFSIKFMGYPRFNSNRFAIKFLLQGLQGR